MIWFLVIVFAAIILFLFLKKKKVDSQAQKSSRFLKEMWSICPNSDIEFCDMVEVFMFITSKNYLAAYPGKVKIAEFKIMLDDMAHDYLPECKSRLLFLKNNISDNGVFSEDLTISDTKAQHIIDLLDKMDINSLENKFILK